MSGGRYRLITWVFHPPCLAKLIRPLFVLFPRSISQLKRLHSSRSPLWLISCLSQSLLGLNAVASVLSESSHHHIPFSRHLSPPGGRRGVAVPHQSGSAACSPGSCSRDQRDLDRLDWAGRHVTGVWLMSEPVLFHFIRHVPCSVSSPADKV